MEEVSKDVNKPPKMMRKHTSPHIMTFYIPS